MRAPTRTGPQPGLDLAPSIFWVLWKKNVFRSMFWLLQKSALRIISIFKLQHIPTWATLFWGWCLFGRLWHPNLFFDQKQHPKCSENDPNVTKWRPTERLNIHNRLTICCFLNREKNCAYHVIVCLLCSLILCMLFYMNLWFLKKDMCFLKQQKKYLLVM